MEIDGVPDEWPVPPMLVQTLVENGVRHGVAAEPGDGTLAVTAAMKDGALVLRVENTGRLVVEAAREGVGVKNTEERLRLLYDEAASFTLRDTERDTVVVTIRLPAQPAAGALTTCPDPTA